MHKKFSAGLLALAGLVCASSISGAATLDDIMARLDGLQRDNVAIRQQNEVMRKEIAALRQKEQRSAPVQAADTRNAPSRQLSPEASSAMAAVPVRGRYAEPPQAFTWDGFYIGAHAGYGWGKNDWTYGGLLEAPGSTSAAGTNPKTNGILGGIQGGANFQSGMWVFGIEAELAVMDGRNTAGSIVVGAGTGVTATQVTNTQIDWLATFAGRFGAAVDRSLFYVKGGIAAAEYKDGYNWTVSPPAAALIDSATKTDTRVGWMIGAGWEYAFAANWSAKVEYNYMDFGTERQTFSLRAVPPLTATVHQDIEHKIQIVKAGLNYRF